MGRFKENAEMFPRLLQNGPAGLAPFMGRLKRTAWRPYDRLAADLTNQKRW